MYFVKGADQKEYGPVSLEQLRAWIAENRLNHYSLARKDDDPTWRPLAQFPELQDALPGQAPGVPPPAPPAPAAPILAPGSPTGTNYNSSSNGPNTAAPAIAMIVVGGLSLIMALADLVRMLVVGFDVVMKQAMAMMPALQVPPGALGVAKAAAYIMTSIPLTMSFVIIFGGISYLRRKNYGLAMAASILMVIPLCGTSSFVCCAGIPLGVWALIVISKGETKALFS
jgi:hypothetical protein